MRATKEVICQECATKHFVLGPVEDASIIRCRSDTHGGFECDRESDDPDDRPPGALRLICEAFRVGMLCKPEGSKVPYPILRDGCRR